MNIEIKTQKHNYKALYPQTFKRRCAKAQIKRSPPSKLLRAIYQPRNQPALLPLSSTSAECEPLSFQQCRTPRVFIGSAGGANIPLPSTHQSLMRWHRVLTANKTRGRVSLKVRNWTPTTTSLETGGRAWQKWIRMKLGLLVNSLFTLLKSSKC